MNNKQTMEAGQRLVKQYNDAAVLRATAKDRAANAQKMADIYERAAKAKLSDINMNKFTYSGYRGVKAANDKIKLYRSIR